MTPQIINERISKLREVMSREGLGAFIFPSTDPHASEYVPNRWKGREWISGFDGSAGTAVVTMHSAALWTDSRYFLAATEKLRGTEFKLMKERIEGTPTIAQWISTELADSTVAEAGIDGTCCSAATAETLTAELRAGGGITLRTNFDPLCEIWTGRPTIPSSPISLHPLKYAGETAKEKLQRIRRALREVHADGMLVSALDDIAWTTNLRGTDVHCNPVFVAYLLIATDRATLFVDRKKLSAEVADYLKSEGIGTDEYENLEKGIADYNEYNILLSPDETNSVVFRKAAALHHVVRTGSPIPAMKAIKNKTEIEGFHRAMERDGVAMVRFLMWLQKAVADGGQTEMSVTEKLHNLRAVSPLFRGDSFDTIAGYQTHGAIVHYEATPETDAPLRPEGFLLLDSGAQYEDGTTDITRTIALGPLTDEQRHVYTLVLKGHLQLQNLKFPDGACGSQLDAVARMAMWREGMNYMHGTGHGVGSYLNVHEGPHQIRMEWRPAPLRAGMTVTDEPGLYLDRRFGVRTENTLLIQPYKETEFGRFLQFEPLTLCPIDTRPVIREMLSPDETEWLNSYNRFVFDRLSPLLTPDETEWLREQTRQI